MSWVVLILASVAGAQQLPFQAYPPEALTNVAVTAIARDRDGFLWVGTQQDLNRYDGTRFHPWGPDQGLGNRFVTALQVDAEGQLWVGTEGGLFLRRGEGLVAVAGLEDRRIVKLVARDHGVAACTAPAGVFLVDAEGAARAVDLGAVPAGVGISGLAIDGDAVVVGLDRGELRRVPDAGPATVLTPPRDGSTPAQVVRAGDTVVATGANGLVRVRGGKPLPGSDHGSWAGTTALVALPNWLYAGTRDGRLLRAPLSADDTPAPLEVGRGPDAPIAELAVDGVGLVWGRTAQSGLIRFDPRRGELLAIGTRNGLITAGADALAVDDRGLAWIGTWAGITRPKPAFVNHTPADGLSHETIWSVDRLPGPDGPLIVGTEDGVSVEAGGGWATLTHRTGLPCVNARTVSAIGPDRFFVGGIDCAAPLSEVRIVDGALVAAPIALPGVTAVRVIRRAADGASLIGTNVGLYRIEGDLATRIPEIGPVLVYDIGEAPGGQIWLGTDAGLVVRDPSGDTRQLGTAEGLAASVVANVLPTARDQGWIAYRDPRGAAMVRLDAPDGPAITPRDASSGLPSDAVMDLLSTGDTTWIATSRGVARLNGDKVRVLTQADGLLWNDADHNASFADRDGSLWFGTGRGLSHYLPHLDRDPASLPDPVVVLASATLGGAPAVDGVSVGAHGRDLEVVFSSLALGDEDRARFRYRLPPYQPAWTDWTPRRAASFTNLPPGAYVFEVETRASDGRVGGPATLSFSVVPTWRERGLLGWIGLLIGVAGSAVIAVLVQRTRTLQRSLARATRREAIAPEERETLAVLRDELLRDVSLAFQGPLTAMIGQAYAARQTAAGELPEAVDRSLVGIIRGCRRLLRMANHVIDVQDAPDTAPVTVRVDAFLAPAVHALGQVATARELSLHHEIEGDEARVAVHPERLLTAVLIVATDAIDSAPPGSQVTVRISAERGVAEILIGAPGARRATVGRDLEISMAEEMLDPDGGTLSGTADPGIGTTFVIRLPTSSAPAAPVVADEAQIAAELAYLES